jgi:hypothetical protein
MATKTELESAAVANGALDGEPGPGQHRRRNGPRHTADRPCRTAARWPQVRFRRGGDAVGNERANNHDPHTHRRIDSVVVGMLLAAAAIPALAQSTGDMPMHQGGSPTGMMSRSGHPGPG